MLLLHKLLIGLGGTAVIGGVGYGIYHSGGNNESTKPNEEKKEEKIEPSQKGPLDTEEKSNQDGGQQTQNQDSESSGGDDAGSKNK